MVEKNTETAFVFPQKSQKKNTEKETYNLGNIKTNCKYTHATFTKYIFKLIFTAQTHPPPPPKRGLFDTCTLLFACINTHHAN